MRALNRHAKAIGCPVQRAGHLTTADKPTIKEPAMSRRQLALSTFPLTRLRALAAGALLSVGCAGATRVALNDAQRDQLGSVRTVGALSQQELRVTVVPSNTGAAFGLVGALIDASVTNSRAKDAESAVVPVRNSLVGYEPSRTLGVALKRELGSLTWLKHNSVEVRQAAESKAAIAELVNASNTDMLLLIQTDYQLAPAFEAMVVKARVSMLPRKSAAPPREPTDDDPSPKADEPKPVYFNTISASAPLPGFTAGKTTMAEAANLWADNDGKYARRALAGGIDELARMIAFDLAQGGPPDAPAAEAVLREENGRKWLRSRSGELRSEGELYR